MSYFSVGLLLALRRSVSFPLAPAGVGLNTEFDADVVDVGVAGALEPELVVSASAPLEYTSAATATASIP
jgi:hypothetical protein